MNGTPLSNETSSNRHSSLSSTSYKSVTFKKNTGTLILNESALTYYPANATPLKYEWITILKHQVSPASHHKHLLKISLHKSAAKEIQGKKSTSQAYEFTSRSELERIRKDVSTHLVNARRIQAQNAEPSNGGENGNRKRKLDAIASPGMLPKSSLAAPSSENAEEKSSSSFTSFTQSEYSITCASLLASDRNLAAQESLLATKAAGKPAPSENNGSAKEQETILTEDDFWLTHKRKLSNQAAKMQGFVSKGISSAMKSSLDIQITGNVSKPIKLGVEEMRQIFIMYPAVHDTYEEKVPLELSEEQFWRKYLESEYFHRDRGRLGSSAKSVLPREKENAAQGDDDDDNNNNNKKAQEEDKEREESARMGAAVANDIFSRKESELQRLDKLRARNTTQKAKLKDLGVGQFDLTATANTERGSKLLLNSNDLHPFDDRGRKVIQKYNRHWAMVLNPEGASAGCDLTALSRQSAAHSLKNDDDAKVNGGFGKEMERLVGFANATDDNVDHMKGMGRNDDYDDSDPVLFEELNLKNIDAYAGKQLNGDAPSSIETSKKDVVCANFAMENIVKPIIQKESSAGNNGSGPSHRIDGAFPHPKMGKILLEKLTNRMVLDSMTEKDTAKMARSLPEEFRAKLTSYTRRSNELLRHFFALRTVMEKEKKLKNVGNKSSKKLKRIVTGIESVYRELEAIRKDDLPQTDLGEQMRKMFLPIMNQLDCAIKLYNDVSTSGGGFVTVGGGFVTVED